MSKILLKEIPLYPTSFKVDVWIGNINELPKLFHKRYGASIEYYEGMISHNQCMDLISTDNSELKGSHRIIVNMSRIVPGIVLHEMNHVIYYLSKITGVELNYQSQEWHSYMLEYLFNECMKKDFKIIEDENIKKTIKARGA